MTEVSLRLIGPKINIGDIVENVDIQVMAWYWTAGL